MSDSIFVMLKKENMPTAKEWSDEVKKRGFGLEIDTTYEKEIDADGIYGFRPCKYYNIEDLGYELDILSRENNSEDFEEWDEDFSEVRECDLVVIFGVFEEDDVFAAMVAGYTLSKFSSGVYFDVDKPIDLNELHKQCREVDTQLKHRPTGVG